jgi:exopolysaccharide production protein ExoY
MTAIASVVQSPLPWWKRSIDVAIAVTALPVLAACTAIVSIPIWLTSPGPVFFRQQRVGRQGQLFFLYKFRTMRVGADISVHQAHVASLLRSNRPMQKMDARRDTRLLPGAWLLRASGLDELPQIINILRGEMSVVGPRPCTPYEFSQYTPAARLRCRAVPGLTGLWQVSGKNKTTFDAMIRLDLAYFDNISPWLDLSIIGRTLPVLLSQVIETGIQRLKAERVRLLARTQLVEESMRPAKDPNLQPAREQ